MPSAHFDYISGSGATKQKVPQGVFFRFANDALFITQKMTKYLRYAEV